MGKLTSTCGMETVASSIESGSTASTSSLISCGCKPRISDARPAHSREVRESPTPYAVSPSSGSSVGPSIGSEEEIDAVVDRVLDLVIEQAVY